MMQKAKLFFLRLVGATYPSVVTLLVLYLYGKEINHISFLFLLIFTFMFLFIVCLTNVDLKLNFWPKKWIEDSNGKNSPEDQSDHKGQ